MPEIKNLILAKAGMETEAHQGMNAAIHAVWLEAGLDLVPEMRKNAAHDCFRRSEMASIVTHVGKPAAMQKGSGIQRVQNKGRIRTENHVSQRAVKIRYDKDI